MRSAVQFKTTDANYISLKLFKHVPEAICERNADTFNNIAETADVPRELTHSLLKPLLPETWKIQRTAIKPVTNNLALNNDEDTSCMHRE